MPKFPSGKRVENIICTEQAFPEFPNLLFGTSIDKRTQYFDATDYLNKQGLTLYSADDFLSAYFHPISALVTAYELEKDKVCIYNVDGHLLMDSNLVYLFISYTNPDFLAHINDRVHDLFTNGFCVSDTYLYRTVKVRLSPEIFNTGDNDDNNQN